MKRILTVVGARPQFIKAAPVSRALATSSILDEILVHTGQHYDPGLSQIFFDEMEIPDPEFRLEVGSMSHGAQTGAMLEKLEALMTEVRPDWTLIYGDTNSTLAGALAAAKLNIPIAHVEAGLRSFNREMPEEINRILADHCSRLLFAPTDTAVGNLRREGFAAESIHRVGDVMYDAALWSAAKAEKHSSILSELKLEANGFVLATIHRASNTDDPERLLEIFRGLDRLSEDHPVVFPAHPRTRGKLAEVAWEPNSPHFLVTEPVGFLDMVRLESAASLVVTDSGGVQKEAYFHRTPCVTLREETEWTELIDLGWNQLLPPTDARTIEETIRAVLESPATADLSHEAMPYGDGDAADRIRGALESAS